MADALISVVVERVAAIIEDQIRYQVNLVRGVEKKVLELSDKLKTVSNVLEDAENRGPKEQGVKSWLRKLQDVAYEMDDILDEWNYALLKHNMGDDQPTYPAAVSTRYKVWRSFIPSSSSCLCFEKVRVHRDTAKKIEKVKASLDQILKEKGEFNFVMSMPETDHMLKSPRVQSTSFVEIENVYGWDIDRNKNDIVSKLLMHNNGDGQLVVSIVGMGGIGKTTLAQLVYNDTRVKDCFELRIWICVSDPFDVAGIARGIVDSVGTQSIPQGSNQLELVLEKLRGSISGKKFLLVLDDVWTEDYTKWEPLRNTLKHGAEGSKIVATTRKEGVAEMMGTLDSNIYRPQHLSNEECWSLLRHVSLFKRGEDERREFEDVGRRIASKCKGLPLAARVLGSLLQSKRSLEEWENVLESEIWRLEKAEVELFPHLLLSYNELSPALKRCFSYCAVYPKDCNIYVENLIEEWMALGYLGTTVAGYGGVEVKGRDYFNKLAMRSLFQEFKRSTSDEEIEWCKMHDIVHDFALFLRKDGGRVVEAPGMTMKSCQVCDPILISRVHEYRCLLWDKSNPPNLCDCLTSHLRVLRFERYLDDPPKGMDKLIHLRWLDLSFTKLSQEDLKIICKLYFLQTLLLSFCRLAEIPGEIGNLVRLRRLDLSGNYRVKELPESMCSLVELQTLDIQNCRGLIKLPEGIHKLRSLQCLLIVNDISASRCFPQGIGELTRLRTLSCDFHIGKGYNKFGVLKKLNRLTGSLRLVIHTSGYDLKEVAEEAREAAQVLRNKVYIRTLDVEFRDDSYEIPASSLLWMTLIEALEPHRKLGELRIKGYKGCRLPQWILSPFNLIKKIELCYMNEVSSLPQMGKLPFLETLIIDYLTRLKVVRREFLGIEYPSSSSSTSNDVVAFPRLDELRFHGCVQWKEWEDITAEEEENASLTVMPCLRELQISCCENLEKLPHRLLRKASSLQILNIRDSRQLQKIYVGSDWRSFIA